MVIRADDRVSTLLAKDESLIDVFAGISPAFERLRDPRLRKVMARLVTVEHAALMAGMATRDLVSRLNEHAARRRTEGATGEPTTSARVASPPADIAANGPPADEAPGTPAALRAIAPDRIVALDVREDLRAGREPFSRIMSARHTVPDGGALCVRAIFEPVPLYAVMAKQGLDHHSERLADDDWQVWFYPATRASRTTHAACAVSVAGARPDDDDDVVILDVRDLEPPEPMVRTLAALEALPPGGLLVQVNVRVPQFLLPQLAERGFTYEIRDEAGLVRVFIRRAAAGIDDIKQTRGNMTNERTLDVRVIPPREKHPTIFATFSELAPGEHFVLVNDHDPKPLRHQFEYEHAGEFGWEYLEQGPAIWRVAISRVASGT